MSLPPLRESQAAAVVEMLARPYLGVFLPMGFGKTRATIEALSLSGWPRTLIVATKRIVANVWPQEIDRWADKELRVSSVVGTAEQRTAALTEEADVYLVSRDNLAWLVKVGIKEARRRMHVRTYPRFEAIVLDELSSYKSPRSSRFKAAKTLTRGRNAPDIVWGLTGTPASDHLMDLWSEVFLIDGGETLGPTITGFRDRYFEPDNPYKPFPRLIPRDGAERQIFDRLGQSCLSMGSEVLEGLVPELTINEVPVPLEPHMWNGPKGYATFMEHAVYGVLGTKREKRESGTVEVPVLADWHISTASVASLRAKALQYTAGFIYHEDHTVEFVSNLKLDVVEELVESLNGDPVLIFYRFREELRRLQERFPEALTVDDKDALDEWNAGRVPILLAHPASAGHGLNLQQGGSQIIFTSVPDSQDQFAQGIGRLHRPGQRNPVMVHVLVTPGTWDPHALHRLQEKRETEDRLLNHLQDLLSV